MMMLTSLTRREMMAGAMAASALGATPVFARDRGAPAAPRWMRLAAANAPGGRDYAPHIEGKPPADLSGDLFRNGPGIFERGGLKKRHLLDGDGIIQRLSFRDGAVRYRNAFVRTEKFVEEEAAGKFLYSTWSTPRPGGPLKNVGGGPMKSQAGVTVYSVGQSVLALDEANPAYEVDPETLATLGPRVIGDPESPVPIKAHGKYDPIRKEWLFIGQSFGRRFDLHAIRCAADGTHLSTQTLADTRQVYIHDFLATERYFVFLMHPCEFHPAGFLMGAKSIIESLKWNGAKGNQIILLPRDGGAPKYLEAPGAFMWHALNAYEVGDEIIADFVAYDDPDHFIGADPQLAAVMENRIGQGAHPGKIRRYRIDVARSRVVEEIVDGGNHEFPMIDGRRALQRHRVGYFTHQGPGALQSGLKRVDFETGDVQVCLLGDQCLVGEPVFAPRRDAEPDEGWLISQCLDGPSGRTYFAVFDAGHIKDGPVARIWLDHAMPISFHGAWRAA